MTCIFGKPENKQHTVCNGKDNDVWRVQVLWRKEKLTPLLALKCLLLPASGKHPKYHRWNPSQRPHRLRWCENKTHAYPPGPLYTFPSLTVHPSSVEKKYFSFSWCLLHKKHSTCWKRIIFFTSSTLSAYYFPLGHWLISSLRRLTLSMHVIALPSRRLLS